VRSTWSVIRPILSRHASRRPSLFRVSRPFTSLRLRSLCLATAGRSLSHPPCACACMSRYQSPYTESVSPSLCSRRSLHAALEAAEPRTDHPMSQTDGRETAAHQDRPAKKHFHHTNPSHVRPCKHENAFHVRAWCGRDKVKQCLSSRDDGDLHLAVLWLPTAVVKQPPFSVTSVFPIHDTVAIICAPAIRQPWRYEARSLPHVEQHNVAAHHLLRVFFNMTQLYMLPTLFSFRTRHPR
jgi:hypothetical protein